MKLQSLMLMLAAVATMTAAKESEQYIVTQSEVPQSVQLDGVVEPVNQGTVAAQTSGRVVGMYVDVNDFVKGGTVLLEISAVQQSAALDAANARLSSALAQNREAQTQVARYRQLFPRGAITRDQMDAAEARARSSAAAVKSAQADVTQAKESLGYTSITAPYDGVVTERHVELGETVSPGTPLLSGFSLDKLRIETEIPQRYQPFVKEAGQFTVLTEDGRQLSPSSMSLFSYAEPLSHTFKIRLDLPEGTSSLLPGMWVKAEFHYGQQKILLIPESSVLRRAELSSVYRLENGTPVLNPVRLGRRYGDYVEVLSGLELGDVVTKNLIVSQGE